MLRRKPARGPIADRTVTFEAKDEGRALDVTTIEQLWAKLQDMPAVAHKSIASTSGFTKAAARKAKKKGITLYVVEPWTTPMRNDVGPQALPGTAKESIRLSNDLLIWLPGRAIRFCCPDGQISITSPTAGDTPVLDSGGKPHPSMRTLGQLADEVMGRSTVLLCSSDEALSHLPTPASFDEPRSGLLGAPWAYQHRVAVDDLDCWIVVEGVGSRRIDAVEIGGSLQWTSEEVPLEPFVMREWATGQMFGAAAVHVMPGWRPTILGIVFGPDSGDMNFHRAEFTDQHQRQFREIRLKTGS